MSEFDKWLYSIGISETRVVKNDLVSMEILKECWDYQQQKISLMQEMIDLEKKETHKLIKSLSEITSTSFFESEESYSIARHALLAFDRDKIKQLEKQLESLK